MPAAAARAGGARRGARPRPLTRARPAAGGGRTLGVPPERLGRWLDGVAERHGSFADVVHDGDAVRITCTDTTTVVLRAPFG